MSGKEREYYLVGPASGSPMDPDRTVASGSLEDVLTVAALKAGLAVPVADGRGEGLLEELEADREAEEREP